MIIEYVVDTRNALDDGIPPDTILNEAENFFEMQYHSFHEDWDFEGYPYLTRGLSGTIAGLGKEGILKKISPGWVVVDWYSITTQDYQKQTADIKKIQRVFNPEQEFNKELL